MSADMLDNSTRCKEGGKKMLLKKFYTCPNCGTAISGEKKEFFACPDCGSALCSKEELRNFKHNYCGNCGYELTSAKEEALALVKGKN